MANEEKQYYRPVYLRVADEDYAAVEEIVQWEQARRTTVSDVMRRAIRSEIVRVKARMARQRASA